MLVPQTTQPFDHSIPIWQDKYAGWYSYNDETFVMEKDQIITEDGKRLSKDSKHELEYIEEEGYMFDFSEYIGFRLKLRKNIRIDIRLFKEIRFLKIYFFFWNVFL